MNHHICRSRSRAGSSHRDAAPYFASALGVLGLGTAYAAGRTVETLLAGVPTGDATTCLSGVGLALATTVTGSLLPTLRAARLDPTETLRAN